MRRLSVLMCSTALAASGLLCAQGAPAKSAPLPANAAPAALLPQEFAGWVQSAAPQIATAALQADAANAAALREYDFTGGEAASYKRGGDTLTVARTALRRHQRRLRRILLLSPVGLAEGGDRNRRDLGPQPRALLAGYHRGRRELLSHRSHVGCGAARVGKPSAASRKGTRRSRLRCSPICRRLRSTARPRTTRLGPAGYAGSGGVLPPDLVGFDRGAEAVTANYSLRSGPATLTIIDYPTPQMAAAQESKIRGYIKAGNQAQPAVAQAARRLRPGFARSAPQRPARGPRQWRRHSRRKPQAAGDRCTTTPT